MDFQPFERRPSQAKLIVTERADIRNLSHDKFSVGNKSSFARQIDRVTDIASIGVSLGPRQYRRWVGTINAAKSR
jgi:hypothetical protein